MALSDTSAGGVGVGVEGVLSRGVFLACSWTWCIGMFFPVYLIGDFGVWGWAAFAVPNVIGAGAMGWVLRRPGASEGITSRHVTAARWFSIVTVLFHVYFASWFFEIMVGRQFGTRYVAGPVAAWLMLISGCVLAALGSRWWGRAAWVVWVFSISAGVAAGLTGDTLSWPAAAPRQELWELACAVPALVFGFALCPYLDLTFHRVRRETPGTGGTAAFWVGFLVFFTPMIVLTLLYAGGLQRGAGVSMAIVGHVFAQSVFTVGAHLRELFEFGVVRSRPGVRIGAVTRDRSLAPLHAAAALGMVFVAMCGVLLTYLDPLRPDYSHRRLGYELFMSFYGLVFPAYVWIVIVERGLSAAARRWLLAGALLLAAPCFWLGYIEQWYLWLVAGVAIPLVPPVLWRLVRDGKTAPREPASTCRDGKP